jgi:hypothetical protein
VKLPVRRLQSACHPGRAGLTCREVLFYSEPASFRAVTRATKSHAVLANVWTTFRVAGDTDIAARLGTLTGSKGSKITKLNRFLLSQE